MLTMGGYEHTVPAQASVMMSGFAGAVGDAHQHDRGRQQYGRRPALDLHAGLLVGCTGTERARFVPRSVGYRSH